MADDRDDALHPLVAEAIERRAELPAFDELGPDGARDRIRTLAPEPGEPPVRAVRDATIPGPDGSIPVRVYEPSGEPPFPTLAYFQGGGWVGGDLDTHDRLCRELATASEHLVVSVEYRRAPESPFPAAVEDCWAATTWLAAEVREWGGDPDSLVVAGDSSGGNLAAVVALMARDRDGPDLDRQVLLYPAVAADAGRYDSFREYGEGYGLDRSEMRWFTEQYLDSDIHVRNPYAFPTNACDLSGVAPATVITAAFDPLRDAGVAYADRLRDAGVAVTHEEFGDVNHGFITMLQEPFDLDRAHEAIDSIARSL